MFVVGVRVRLSPPLWEWDAQSSLRSFMQFINNYLTASKNSPIINRDKNVQTIYNVAAWRQQCHPIMCPRRWSIFVQSTDDNEKGLSVSHHYHALLIEPTILSSQCVNILKCSRGGFEYPVLSSTHSLSVVQFRLSPACNLFFNSRYEWGGWLPLDLLKVDAIKLQRLTVCMLDPLASKYLFIDIV